MKCSGCVTNMQVDDLFCPECGQKVSEKQSNAVLTAEPAPLSSDDYIAEDAAPQKRTAFMAVQSTVMKILTFVIKNVRITPNDIGLFLISLAMLLLFTIDLVSSITGLLVAVACLLSGIALAMLPQSVYVSGGKHFHLYHRCGGMEHAKMVSAKRARQSGLRPCEECTGFSIKSVAFSILNFFCIIFVASYTVATQMPSRYTNSTFGFALIFTFACLLLLPIIYIPMKVGFTRVWLQRGNEKYHTDRNCSGMKAARKMGIIKAKSLGYVPCSKCCKEQGQSKGGRK